MIRIIICAIAIAVASLGYAPAAQAERPYKNCTEAHDDGRYGIPKGDDAYWAGGDRDDDGYACE